MECIEKRVAVAVMGASASREMCLMHVSFCVSSGGEGIIRVSSDLSTHFIS